MYLKQVEMRGFKSFADRTVVEFKDGVTCVVGPNGSGKSNITDAVRWVLGEQRVKTLRGNKMEDVIFNGTKHRKALGLAEVKLTFDNTDHFFPLEYDEISVVRRVHRSGDSEYLINQMPCRLKDVRELFMDTGIGREGYSIIGQGRIDEILSNNKEERRLLFEEAAGILKYKTRKIESEKKLQTTSDNLLRIQDIISEIEDRVEPLRLESERAKQYIDLTEALKNIELNYFSKRYMEIEQSLLDVLSQMREFEDQIKAIDERHLDLKREYSTQDEQMIQINRDIRALEAQYHELQNYESKTIGERDLLTEKKANTSLNIKRVETELNEIENERKSLSQQYDGLVEEKTKLHEEWQQLEALLLELSEKLDAERERLGDAKHYNETSKKDVIDQLNQIEMKKQEIETLSRLSVSLNEKLNQIEQQVAQQTAAIQQSHQDKELVETQLKAHQANRDALNSKLAQAIQFTEFNKKKLSESSKELESMTSDKAKCQTECKLLKTLEEEYDGYDKGVKDILMSLEDQSGIIGIVASIIEVPKKYEVAIEVALGKAIQNIVCEKISDAKRSIEFLRRRDLGRVTFLPLENLEDKGHQSEPLEQAKNEKGFVGIASDLISIESKYQKLGEFLLGRIIIAEDFDTASRMIKIKNLKYKVITLEGDILVPGGAITGGSFKSKVSNILSRKRIISELEAKIKSLETSCEVKKTEVEQFSMTLTEQDSVIKQLRSELDALRLEIVRLENTLENHLVTVGNSSEVLAKYQSDYQTLKTEYEETVQRIDLNQTDILSTKELVDKIEQELNQANSEIEKMDEVVQKINDEYTAVKIKLASFEQMVAFKEREVLRAQDDLDILSQKCEMRKKQMVDFSDHTEIFDDQLQLLNDKIEQIKQDAIACKKDIDSKTLIKQEAYRSLNGMTSEIEQLNAKHDAAKENIHKLEVKKVKLEVEKDTVTTELWEKYEMSIAEALQVEEVPYQKSEMKQLRYELKLLGTVNVNAIKEYEEVSTRYTFLSEQKKDLLDAIHQLEKIISELEKKMIEMFKENFEVINSHFKGTFKSLFNGGDAELLLSDYDNILDCDVEIIAQPPGKKLQSINLLSGGEKALTAIALLFAILSTKPTPFCILDEIEAALDDVNVYRFADFIKEYASNSQFVVITHRKGTMEVADTLYGVTMEEYGISKVLSVKLEDIAAQLD